MKQIMIKSNQVFWRYPIQAERELLRAINMAISDIKTIVIDSSVKKMELFYKQSRYDAEEYEEEVESWSDELAAIVAAWLFLGKISTTQKKRFFDIGKMISSYNESQFLYIINKSFGVYLTPDLRLKKISTWLNDVDLILQKKIDAFCMDVGYIVRDSISKGVGVKETKSLINKKSMSLDESAKLIAVNSVGNLNSELSNERLTDAGVYKYEWRSQGDDRVRPDHVEKNGKIFDWRKRPDGGHPGEPIRCRCVAMPVIEKGDRLIAQHTAWTTSQFKMYRRGVHREQRPERDAKYRAVMRSAKFSMDEIKILSEHPDRASDVFSNIISSGRASVKEMIDLMAKERYV